MRKRPKQQRSRYLVDSLLRATAQIISQEGLEKATTARIAERAGVSVGSLYQYFNDKQELYDAVLERLTQELQRLVDMNLAQLEQGSVHTFTHSLLLDVWDFLDADGGLYLGIVRHWAQLDFLRFLKQLEHSMSLSFAMILMKRGSLKPSGDLAVLAFILINSVLFTFVRYISDPPAYISREQLIAQFAAMAEGMLGGDGALAPVGLE